MGTGQVKPASPVQNPWKIFSKCIKMCAMFEEGEFMMRDRQDVKNPFVRVCLMHPDH